MAPPANISVETFLGLVKQCGLIDGELLKKHWKELKEAGIPLAEPRQIADEFVNRNLLTRWQAEKLLQGRHKGFFLGKYRLLSLLGSGGMSAVYLAEHVLMRRRVAIKVLPRQRVEDSSYLERFHREAQAVAALDHRNIVRAYDVDQEREIHFLVMEYVPGQSLHELVAKNGPVEFVPAAEYMRQAAEGLHHAHRMGMVHRDIKPGNLLLDEKGTVKLLDLGLARFFDEKDEHSLTVKHDEKVLGTADYLSPEQALNSHTVDLRSDIYSMGCTLYFLLTGHPPFPDGTLAQRLLAHQAKQPRPLQEERPEAPPGLVTVLEKMMAKKPDERYQTAKEAATALLDWLNESGGSTWASMHPAVAGTSQYMGDQTAPGSTANVLSADLAPAASRPHAPLLGTAIGAAAETVGPDRSDVGQFLGSHFSGQAAETGGAFPAPETAEDADMAALFSEIASEATTTISRSSGKRPRPASEPTAAIPEPPELINTIDMPDLNAAQEEIGQAPQPEFAWPTTEQFSSEPPPVKEQPQFAPTLIASEPPASMPPTVLATPVIPAEEADPFLAFAAEAPRAAPPIATPVVAQVAGTSVPIARPVGPAPAAKAVARRTTKPPTKLPLIVGSAGVLAVLLAVGGYFAFFRTGASGSASNQGQDGKQSAKSKNKSQDKKKKSAGSDEKIAEMRGEFSVGPSAKFKTIAAVLTELKTLKNNKSRNAVQIVKVAAGQTFAERIVIDDSYPRGIQFIAEPGPPAVLAPSGPEPIVVLRSTNSKVENFHLEGFRLDAAGKDVAVELSEWVPGTRLKRLDISGFGKTGVHFYGAQTYGKEDERIVLEAATFHGAASAVGVQISRKIEDSGFIRINQCRFFGPLECGVLLEANARGIEISESIFADTVTGVKFQGEDRAWNDILIGADTFYRNDRAIVFTNMPATRSRDFQFHNNLFVESKTADAVVEKDYKPADFFVMYRTFPGGSGYNWTTRPQSDPPNPDELVTMFETVDGRRNVGDLQFVSTDPASPDFLAPAPNAPQRQRSTLLDQKRFGTQIGAVRPR
jgi:serine/threonine-protein kinase